ncbi:hypothetical protein [Cellulosimicrobium sp. JZ28]
MTGLVARTGWSVRLVRTLLEVVVVTLGWALGGTLGWATVAYALAVGPIVQLTARWFAPRGLVAAAASEAAADVEGASDGEPASDIETASREPVPATAGPRPDEGGMPASGR